ncbi:hypothetical protein CRYUN_Cryun41cG0047800 [Craigia yunnanensis]
MFQDDQSTQQLFSGCPLLEDLSLDGCDWKNVTESPSRFQLKVFKSQDQNMILGTAPICFQSCLKQFNGNADEGLTLDSELTKCRLFCLIVGRLIRIFFAARSFEGPSRSFKTKFGNGISGSVCRGTDASSKSITGNWCWTVSCPGKHKSIGPEARNYLNKIVFYLFSPALLVSNLAETITHKILVTLWFMPLNILLTYLIGSALGWILIKITKTTKHLQGVVIGCCCAGNLGNLLLIVVPAVCEESNSPFADSSTCSTDAEAYASLSMAVAAIYTWTYAYSLVGAYAIKSPEHNSIQSSEGASEPSSDSCTEALLTSSYSQISEDGSGKVELPLTNLGERKKMSFMERIVQCLKSIMSKIDPKKVFAPSTIATISFVVKKYFYLTYWEAAIPSMTLIMGANLLKGGFLSSF